MKEPDRPQNRPLASQLLEDDFESKRRTLLLAMALRHPHTARWPDAQRDGQPVNARASLRRALPLGGYQSTLRGNRLAATPPREEG